MKQRLSVFSITFMMVLVSCVSTPERPVFNEDSTRTLQSKTDETQKMNFSPINNPEPQGSVELIDDFEDEFMMWYPESSNRREDRSIKVENTEDWATSNDRSLSLSFAPLKDNFSASFSSPLDKSACNWQGAKTIAVDFYNPTDRPFSLSVEVQSGNSHSITKTQEIIIGCGDNLNVYFDLEHDISDELGNPQPGIPEDDDVRQMSFRIKEITEKKKGGFIFVDNIRLVK